MSGTRLRFFRPREALAVRAAAARLVNWPPAQDRALTPVVLRLDARLARGESDGNRYEGMPDARTAWREGLAGLDEAARALGDAPFARLEPAEQERVLRTVAQGSPPGERWDTLPARCFLFRLLGATLVRLVLEDVRLRATLVEGAR